MGNIEAQRRYRERHPDRCAAATKKWGEKNRDHIRERAREYRAKNPARVLGYKLKRYGITADEYLQRLAEQNGVCAICGLTCEKWARLSVDHHHDTGQVRGLLCDACNVAIGSMKEDPARLRAAADYLEKHR